MKSATWIGRSERRKVSFSTKDEIRDIPSDLILNDVDFIKVGNEILTRLERMSQETKRPSLFPKAFVAKFDTARTCKRQSGGEEIILTKSVLSKFKQALFLRLDDDNPNSCDYSSTTATFKKKKSMIQSMISRILRYVDMVGWPVIKDVTNSSESIPFDSMGRRDCWHHRSILSPSNNRRFNTLNSAKSSDWGLFQKELHGRIITEKENVDEFQDANVARSTIPSDYFESPITTPMNPSFGSYSLSSVSQNYPRNGDKVMTMNAKENLSLYFDSPDEATEEIFRLSDVVAMKGIDSQTKSYCLHRIKYLKMILEENGYHNTVK